MSSWFFFSHSAEALAGDPLPGARPLVPAPFSKEVRVGV